MRARQLQSRASTRLFIVGAACASAVALSVIAAPIPSVHPVAALEARSQSDLPFGVSVSESHTIDLVAGEVQSAVVPPGTLSECPQGRLLISKDYEKNPGEVRLLDLDNLDATPSLAAIDTPTGWGNYRRILSNDHDLIALPNGTVLLVKMGQSRAPLNPKPVWFDYAYKLSDGWGPGARSEVLVWRSVDCGKSFAIVSAVDTGKINDGYGTPDDGSGGLPQNSLSFAEPATDGQPIWQMGGTDGILTRVDPATGRVYLTIGLVGNIPLMTSPVFLMSSTKLNRTVVMTSSNDGSTWQPDSVLPFTGWRVDVVARPNQTLAFAHQGWNKTTATGSAFVMHACKQALGFDFCPLTLAPEKTGQWGWNALPWTHPILYKYENETKDASDYMKVNLAGQTILTRSPNSQNLLLAYMDTIHNLGDGYRLFQYDGQSSWLQMAPIAPKSQNPDNFVLHLTAVDPGRGPLFFYWYDVDTVTKRATIRGRLVTSETEESVNFPVSHSRFGERSFDVTTEGNFYGDYHTAGGYVVDGLSPTYHYYPVWVEPDGKVRVAHVTFAIPFTRPYSITELLDLGYLARSGSDRVIFRENVDLSTLAILDEDQEEPRPIVIR